MISCNVAIPQGGWEDSNTHRQALRSDECDGAMCCSVSFISAGVRPFPCLGIPPSSLSSPFLAPPIPPPTEQHGWWKKFCQGERG